MTQHEIAQWVIDNRYPKSENEKVSDFEMYHKILEMLSATRTDATHTDAVEFAIFCGKNYDCFLDKNANGGLVWSKNGHFTTEQLYEIFKNTK